MSHPQRPTVEWTLRDRTLALGPKTLIMGVLNVTPDSFSDGGLWLEHDAAIERGLEMLRLGAYILDIGGESTRPNADPTSPADEQHRILPVLQGILRAHPDALLSVDTYHADTAARALDTGAAILNDVSGGLWDPGMLPLCATVRAPIILMHTRGRPQQWRTLPPLPAAEVVPLVLRELTARLRAAEAAGLDPRSIALDPGFGFGKSLDENYPLLAHLDRLAALGRPVVAGLSRKGFLRRSLPPEAQENADALRDATLAANVAAILAGAHIVRVHDVPAAVHAAAIADRILAAPAI